MKKVIFSPSTYIQGRKEIKNLGKYVKELDKISAYIIIDEFIYNNYKSEIIESFISNKTKYNFAIFNSECCIEEVDRHRKNLKEYDIIIGIGGGKALDLAKAISYYEDYPIIIVPTIASTDAPCSRLSAIYTKKGEFLHYITLKNSPNIVLVDVDIIMKAPVRFLVAGIGDALSTYYETNACYKSNSKTITGGYVTKPIFMLSKLCRDTLLKEGHKAVFALKDGIYDKSLDDIIEANIYLSGVGFENGGLSVAHALHNGLTILEESYKSLHGEKVAFSTIVQTVLENRPLEEIKELIYFCKKIGLPTSFETLGISNISDEQIRKVAKESCNLKYTMKNHFLNITEEDIFSAMVLTNKIEKEVIV